MTLGTNGKLEGYPLKKFRSTQWVFFEVKVSTLVPTYVSSDVYRNNHH